MKNKKIILILIILLTACLGLGFVYKNIQKQNINSIRIIPPPSSLGPLTQTNPLHKGEEKEGSLVTKTTPQTNNLSFTNNIEGETNVYDFMSKLRSENKINFTEKKYIGMGEFIDSINGTKNNQNQSWIYYVNGVEAQVGVSNYKIKIGDIVSWKYEKSNF